jgi:hypothetical protein
MWPKFKLMTDEQLSVQMIVLSGGIIAVVLIVFEVLMPALPHSGDFETLGVQPTKDPSFSFIIYCLASALHILLSSFFAYQLWQGIRKLSPVPRFAIKRRIMIVSILVFGVLLVSASVLELKIVTYSHHRTLEIWQLASWDSLLKATIPFTSVSWFSLYPLFLIFCGIIFSVVACIWSAVKAVDITQNQLEKKEFNSDVIWSEVSMFSVVVSSVFLTSTVATTFYLGIGQNFSGSDGYGRFYSNSSEAMSILWATCYSAIMIVIVLFPTGNMNEVARNAHKRNRVLGKDTERFKFVYGALSTERVLKMLAILIAPVYVASIRAAIS